MKLNDNPKKRNVKIFNNLFVKRYAQIFSSPLSSVKSDWYIVQYSLTMNWVLADSGRILYLRRMLILPSTWPRVFVRSNHVIDHHIRYSSNSCTNEWYGCSCKSAFYMIDRKYSLNDRMSEPVPLNLGPELLPWRLGWYINRSLCKWLHITRAHAIRNTY